MHDRQQQPSPELEALHRELEALEIEERPSFGPELKAELEAELTRVSPPRSVMSGARRLAMAASIGGILVLGAVPGVRASLVRAFEVAVSSIRGAEELQQATVDIVSGVTLIAEDPGAEPPRVFVPIDEAEPPSDGQASWVNEPLEDLAPPPYAYPVLLDPENAERIVQMFYPRRLQEERVGGEVRVMVWVDETGVAKDREVLSSSNVGALDRAALSALGRLRFRPARRGGSPVGSWVKFTIRFEPPPRTGALERGTIQESESMVVDAGRSAAVPLNPN